MRDKIRWIRTHCARMDHGGCSILAEVRNNKIIRIKGDPAGFLNSGYVCPKGLASPERLSHPRRLKYPLRRKGGRGEGQWQRVSWEEAMQEIGENLERAREKHGAKGVAFCQGMPKGMEHFVLIRLANVFGSPNVVGVQDVCHAPREVSGVHTCGFYPVADFHHQSRLAIMWGSNLTSTNEEGEICSLLLEQVRRGTDLIVIDPRRTALARKARLWLQIRPGADNALALAFLNVIIGEGLFRKDFVEDWTHGFEELAVAVRGYTPEKMSSVTWVEPGLIREAARSYALSGPAAIQWGNPIEHNTHAFDTARALVCLMAICGDLDVPGGNIQANDPPILGLGKFVRADLIPAKRKEMIHAYHNTIPGLMTVPGAFFRRAVLEEFPYPVKAAYFQCTNPLITYADSRKTFGALMRLDFFVVSDIFMTPTAALADVVLPAATHFEFNDIGHYGLGHGYVLARPRVVDPPGECWPDMKILNELGRAITPKQYWYEDYEDLLGEVLGPSGLTYTQFAEKGYLKGEDRFQKYLSSGFRTSTGKVELCLKKADSYPVSPLPRFDGLPVEDDPDYPLVLTSAKSPHYLHSSYRWLEVLRRHSPGPVAEIHPDTAAEYGINEGEEVIIETRAGRITQTARLSRGIHPRVINASYGWWFPEGSPGSQYEWERSNFNMLTSVGELGKEFGTPNLKGIGCRIAPIGQDG
jgi:anaerobic selenocysteine-containing dehydrogenase